MKHFNGGQNLEKIWDRKREKLLLLIKSEGSECEQNKSAFFKMYFSSLCRRSGWEGFQKRSSFTRSWWILRLWNWTLLAICPWSFWLEPGGFYFSWVQLAREKGCNPLADGLPLPYFSSGGGMQIRRHTDTGQPGPQACWQHQRDQRKISLTKRL